MVDYQIYIFVYRLKTRIHYESVERGPQLIAIFAPFGRNKTI